MLSSWPEAQQSWKTNPFPISDKGWLLIWRRRKKNNTLHTWNWSSSTNKGKHRCAALNSVFKFLRYRQGPRTRRVAELKTGANTKKSDAQHLTCPRSHSEVIQSSPWGGPGTRGRCQRGLLHLAACCQPGLPAWPSVSSRSAGRSLASSPLRVQW